MKPIGILFGAVALLSVTSTFGNLPEEEANALAKIFSEPGLWGKGYLAALESLPAWNRLGDKRVALFADRIVGGSSYQTQEEAQKEAEKFTEASKTLRTKPTSKFEALLRGRGEGPSAGKIEVIPLFREDETTRLVWTSESRQLLAPGLTIAIVTERLGAPETVTTEVIHGRGERRPVILTIHTYAGGAVAFAESDASPRPGSVDRVILDVPTVTAALFEEAR